MVSRLELGGIVRLGVLAIVATAGLIAAIAVTIPLGARIVLAELKLEDTKKVALRHAKGGIVTQVHVKTGDSVTAGDLLVSLDTRDLDEQISALKLQAEAAAMKLSGIRKEAQLVNVTADTQPNAAARKAELSRRLIEVEKETIGLHVRIAHAEQDVVRAEIRAPVAGRVLDMALVEPGKILGEDSLVAELLPATGQVILAGRAIDANRNDLIPGRTARITLVSPISHRAETFEARVLEASQTSAHTSGSDTALEKVRLELKTSFEAFKTRVGMGDHLVGELRLGRVEARSAQVPAPAAPMVAADKISQVRS